MKCCLGIVIVVMSFFGVAQAQTYIQLILDLSGSMYEKLESGEPKIDAARVVLTDFISELPDEDLNVGLRVYGATTGAMDGGACEDSQLSVAMQGVDKDALLGIVSTTNPKGATPIAYSLDQAGADFQGLPSEARKIIVLVTDGEESCGGDLKAALETYRAQGIEIDLRIIGLGLDERAAQSFEGVGTFQNALTADEFSTALETATAVEPTPVAANSQSFFPFEVSGSATEGQTIDYDFPGNENTPILFQFNHPDNLYLKLQVLNDLGDVIVEDNNQNHPDRPVNLAFTPQEDGSYTLRVAPWQYASDYQLIGNYVAGDPSQRTQPRDILVFDTSKEGILAPGAYDDYSFDGVANTPILFRLNHVDNLYLNLQVLNDLGDVIAKNDNQNHPDRPVDVVFTPQEDGKYTLRIAVWGYISKYELLANYVAGDPSQRIQPRDALLFDTSKTGILAQGAYDDYPFDGAANTPLFFRLNHADNLYLKLQVLNDLGDVIVESDNQNHPDNPVQMAFTPQQDGNYTLRIAPWGGVSEYELIANYVAGDPSQRTQPRDTLVVDTSKEGILAPGAYDDYTFDGVANTPVLFRLNHPDNLYLNLQILNNVGDVIAKNDNQNHPDHPVELVFTPQENGKYTLRIAVWGYISKYELIIRKQ